MPPYLGKVVVFCMFNDLWLSKNQKNMLWHQGAFSAGGDPLLDEFRYGMKKLARAMARMPNSVFVGPGNARLWEIVWTSIMTCLRQPLSRVESASIEQWTALPQPLQDPTHLIKFDNRSGLTSHRVLKRLRQRCPLFDARRLHSRQWLTQT